MKKQLNFVIQLPLKEIALRNVIVRLWSQLDILNQIEHFDPFLTNGERLVRNRLSALELPKSLLKEMMPLVKPIGNELIMWVKRNLYIIRDRRGFMGSRAEDPLPIAICNQRALEKLSWTSIGTINDIETAENFIRSKILDAHQLYLLACAYCLKEYVRILWEELSETSKKSVYFSYENFLPISHPFHIKHPHLAPFWTFGLVRFDTEETFDNEIDFHHKAFLKAVQAGNLAATKYFYSKYPWEKKGVALFEAVKYLVSEWKILNRLDYDTTFVRMQSILYEHTTGYLTNVLCYLMSQMSRKQLMAVLKQYSYCVLTCLTQWPWQDLLLDIADLTWKFFSVDDYVLILHYLGLSKTISGPNADLFCKFFRRSPAKFRNYFIDQLCLSDVKKCDRNFWVHREKFLYDIFKAEETEIIRCIFQNVDAPKKARLLFGDQGLETCWYLIDNDKWHMLKLLIEALSLSKELRATFKEDLKTYIGATYFNKELICKMQQWKELFQLPGAPNKRRLEDEIVTEGTHKKLCTKNSDSTKIL